MKPWKPGDSFIWLTGSALAVALLMVIGLVSLIFYSGAGFFWPHPLQLFTLKDGTALLGQITAREVIPDPDAPEGHIEKHRLQIKRGNRDLYGTDFVWLDESQIASRSEPGDAVLIERSEWGAFMGYFQSLEVAGEAFSNDWKKLEQRLDRSRDLCARIRLIERKDIGAINARQEKIRIKLRKGPNEALSKELKSLQLQYQEQIARLSELRAQVSDTLLLGAPGKAGVKLPLEHVIRIYRPNQMTAPDKIRFYVSKVWEFLSEEPRESNTEGGVWPAIFGTVLMVLLMSVFVTPLGVVAAIYLREYAKQGPLVSAVRIAVNNLAGVPSIVFGVFGVGFFIYYVGGGIDQFFFADRLPTPTFGTGGILWASLTLSLMTLPVVMVATEEGLAAIPPSTREGSLALGATQFETTWRVVLPAVTPSILTGLILAMARAAGEVAPLMITGVVKLAPTLPVDGSWPFLHLDRKFMHLGFHIYDVGFQSPNVDAARPIVYTTTILLLLIVLFLNLAAISIRARLRKKYATTHL